MVNGFFICWLSLALHLTRLLNCGSIFQSCEVYQNKWDISVTDRFHCTNGHIQSIQRGVWEWKLKLRKKAEYVRLPPLYDLIEFHVSYVSVNILVRIKIVFLSDSTEFIEISIEFHSYGSSVISLSVPLSLSSMVPDFYGVTDLNRLLTHTNSSYMIFVARAHQISQLWMQIDTCIFLCFCGGVTNKFRSDKQQTQRHRPLNRKKKDLTQRHKRERRKKQQIE